MLDPDRREELIDKYAQKSVDDMDMDAVCGYVKDRIEENLNRLSDKELLAEIQEWQPQLLEESDA